jgi:putative nucleotidyltransferase with HDIG domain
MMPNNNRENSKLLATILEVSKTINSVHEIDDVLSLITKKAAKIMGAKACSLRLLDRNRKELILRASYGLEGRQHLKDNLKVGQSIAGRVVERCKPIIVSDISKEPRYYSPSFARREGLLSLLSVPLVQKNKIIGTLTLYSRRAGHFDKEDERILSMFASQAAIAIENARLFEETRHNFLNTMKILARMIDAKDSYTHQHSERVMHLAVRIAEEMGLDEEEKEAVQYASLLHDLGKIGVDLSILRKPGKLGEEEWREIANHPVIGAKLISQTGFLGKLVPIILHHHECYNGGGYPNPRLKLQRIPLGARILAVVDAYEAMITSRPYRQKFRKDDALKEIVRCTGTQFDPHVVRYFLKVIKLNGNQIPHPEISSSSSKHERQSNARKN